MKYVINQLFGIMVNHKKTKVFIMIALTILASILEVVSIGLIMPFMALISDMENFSILDNIPFFGSYIQSIDGNKLIILLAIAFGFFSIAASIFRIIALNYSTKLSFELGADLSESIFSSILYQSYDQHLRNQSSDLISALATKVNLVIFNVLVPASIIASNIILTIAIMSMLFYIDPFTAFAVIGVFSLFYIVTLTLTKKIQNKISLTVVKESNRVIKYMQEPIQSIRDVIMDSMHKPFIERFGKSDRRLRMSQANAQIIAQSPRFILEGFTMVGFSLFVILQNTDSVNISNSLPIIALLALSAQRLLPVVQQIYASVISIRTNKNIFIDISNILSKEINIESKMGQIVEKKMFMRSIYFQDVSYSYHGTNSNVLNKVNLEIPFPSTIGIVGDSGSGKSTLVDILMGLLPPSSGKVLIGSRVINCNNIVSWRKGISHVSQKSYMINDSIINNLKLEGDEVDIEYIWKCLRIAEIDKFVESLPLGIDTIVGDNGSLLSGGQRQRLLIAKSLIRDSVLLILDEATNGLDRETERKVIDNIISMKPNMTIILITHRIEITKGFDFVFKVENKNVSKVNNVL